MGGQSLAAAADSWHLDGALAASTQLAKAQHRRLEHLLGEQQAPQDAMAAWEGRAACSALPACADLGPGLPSPGVAHLGLGNGGNFPYFLGRRWTIWPFRDQGGCMAPRLCLWVPAVLSGPVWPPMERGCPVWDGGDVRRRSLPGLGVGACFGRLLRSACRVKMLWL